MTVRVTEEDIKAGQRFSNHSCPIALAIRRTTQYRAFVSEQVIGYLDETGYRDTPTPVVAREFIRKFDKGFKVQPFEFSC